MTAAADLRPRPRRTTVGEVLARWAKEGPLIHQATCFDALNQQTGGGPVYGSRWYVMGAPDASKTLLLLQLAHMWSELGITVGMHAVDEEDGDLVTRLIQRTEIPSGSGAHFQRSHCEVREPRMLALMQSACEGSGLVFYDDSCTIEEACSDLAALAGDRKQKAIMMTDSIQTVECAWIRKSKSSDVSMREKITQNVRAVRACATAYKMLVMASSEMNRAAYRTIGKADQNDMAAAKESGAVEYSARVMLALRNVTDEPNCIEARIIKNKHGPSFPMADPFYLQIDRHKQWLFDRDPPEGLGALVEAVIQCVRRHPAGVSTEVVRVEVGKGKGAVLAALQSAEAAKAIRRLNGDRSPWVPFEFDPGPDPDLDFP